MLGRPQNAEATAKIAVGELFAMPKRQIGFDAPKWNPSTRCPGRLVDAVTFEVLNRRLEILGVAVDAQTLPDAVARVESWIYDNRRAYAIFRDVHGVMLCQRDERLRAAHKLAGLVATDGMPLVWLARRAFGAGVGRVYGPDFMELFCSSTDSKGYRHYFYGSDPPTTERLIASLRRKAPGLIVAGTHCPPYRPLAREEDEKVIRAINDSQPDLVWVGLGTPKQEIWMMEHLGRVSAKALLGVGAAFDFLAGTKRQAPRFLRELGLEWCFRLATEPRRLAKRYFLHLPAFALGIARNPPKEIKQA